MSEEIDAYSFNGCDDCRGNPEAAPPGSPVSVAPFTHADVAEVAAKRDGEPDGDSYLCLGTLKDGRWFFVSSWEDYSGHG